MTGVGPVIPEGLTIVLGAIVWIPVTVWILSLVHWAISGEIDFLSALLGVSLGFALGFLTLKPPIPIVSPILFVATWLTVILYPVVKSSMDKRALVAIDLESLDRAYQALSQKPDNIGIRLKIARLVYNRGILGHAIAVAEESLKGLPVDLFQDEHKLVGNWKAAAGNPTQVRSLPCLECGTLNAPGLLYCTKCGAPFLLHHARGKWIGPNLAHRVVTAWAAGVILLIGIPVATSYFEAWQQTVVLIALILASTALAYRAIRPKMGETAR